MTASAEEEEVGSVNACSSSNTSSPVTASSPEVHVITGGGGYVGLNIARELQAKGHRIVLFDISKPTEMPHPDMKFVQGDIRNLSDVMRVAQDASCIYHVASFGMSGTEMLNNKLIEAINVEGTKNVIKACRQCGVERLVYTSSVNVVFNGNPIACGDETLPYIPEQKHIDHYSRTKSISEQLVLAANGETVAGDKTLRTVALRSGGIYGPGEMRHTLRIINHLRSGFLIFKFGTAKSDYVHITNLVQAHVKAGEALTPQNKCVAAGQAYTITDGTPINNFEFFKPLIEGLGYTYPKINLLVWIMYMIAYISELVHYTIGGFIGFEPFLNMAECIKVSVNHTFSIEKARRDLGYEPTKVNDMSDSVAYWLERGYHRDSGINGALHSELTWHVKWMLGILCATMIMVFIVV
ncbi:PREDICTED: short-chain dehydrogenase/reductase family 42E member 1-like [Priapulus caudatus]|uniref:Short-chain dehydrogenase/reductase family 42E member 1-like n=1 Tax=Priapulus caudatus TaxID=37621 RepID=A0ABM1DZ40_PRICU|nr:PREDICTED: short-chain dehydrogenase/reductase family 42E member 1-like [Priapulus caudatus]